VTHPATGGGPLGHPRGPFLGVAILPLIAVLLSGFNDDDDSELKNGLAHQSDLKGDVTHTGVFTLCERDGGLGVPSFLGDRRDTAVRG